MYYKAKEQARDEILKAKEESRDQMEKRHALEMSIINTRYLKLKGNLSLRGLIEELEQSQVFKSQRKI